MSAKRSLVVQLNLTGRTADSPSETKIQGEDTRSERNTSMVDAETEVRPEEESRRPKRRRIDYSPEEEEDGKEEKDEKEEEQEDDDEDGKDEEEDDDVNDDAPLNEADESDRLDPDLETPVPKTIVIDLSGNMLLKISSPTHECKCFQIAIETAATISPTFSQAVRDAFTASENKPNPLSLEGDPAAWHNLLDLVSHITKFGEPPLVLPNDLSEAEDRAKQRRNIVEKTALDYVHDKLVQFRPIAEEWDCIKLLRDWIVAWVARSSALSETTRQITQAPYEVPFKLLLKWCLVSHYLGKQGEASKHAEFVLARLEDKVEHREVFDQVLPEAFRERMLAARLRLIKSTIRAIKAFGNKEGDLSSSVPKFTRDREWADITLKSAVYGAFCLYIRRRLISWELLKPSHFTSLHKTRKLLRGLNKCIVNVVKEATDVLPGVPIMLDSRYSPFYEILDVIGKGVAAFNMYNADDVKAASVKGSRSFDASS